MATVFTSPRYIRAARQVHSVRPHERREGLLGLTAIYQRDRPVDVEESVWHSITKDLSTFEAAQCFVAIQTIVDSGNACRFASLTAMVDTLLVLSASDDESERDVFWSAMDRLLCDPGWETDILHHLLATPEPILRLPLHEVSGSFDGFLDRFKNSLKLVTSLSQQARDASTVERLISAALLPVFESPEAGSLVDNGLCEALTCLYELMKRWAELTGDERPCPPVIVDILMRGVSSPNTAESEEYFNAVTHLSNLHETVFKPFMNRGILSTAMAALAADDHRAGDASVLVYNISQDEGPRSILWMEDMLRTMTRALSSSVHSAVKKNLRDMFQKWYFRLDADRLELLDRVGWKDVYLKELRKGTMGRVLSMILTEEDIVGDGDKDAKRARYGV